MRENAPGSGRRSRCGQMPQDSTLEQEVGSWRLFVSRKEQAVYIDTADYHPGLLCLSRQDLERLLERLGQRPA